MVGRPVGWANVPIASGTSGFWCSVCALLEGREENILHSVRLYVCLLLHLDVFCWFTAELFAFVCLPNAFSCPSAHAIARLRS